MKSRFIILLFGLLLVLAGCGIKRDNPLDPQANDLTIPGDVSGLQATAFGSGSSTRYVVFRWNSNNANDTDGYYLYRSLGYYSAFALVDTVLHIPGVSLQQYTHSSANDPTVAPGDYWYKISAFKNYSAGRLEGRLGTPLFVRIPR
jgi:hypothetical protein